MAHLHRSLLTRRALLPTVALLAGLVGGAALAPAWVGTHSPVAPADTVLVGGEILTMEDDQPTATAVAIRHGRILAVGDDSAIRSLAGPQTRVVDLAGRTVIPGLVDGHTHAIRGGQTFTAETRWFDQTTLSSALAALTAAAAHKAPGDWVGVVGAWHPDQFDEHRAPTVAELSAAVPDVPVLVQFQYRYLLINAAGIKALGLDDPSTPLPVPGLVVERDASGAATGKLTGGIGPFSTLVAKLFSGTPQRQTESLAASMTELNSYGITGVIDDAAGTPEVYQPLFALERAGRLTVRTGYRISAPAAGGGEAAFFDHAAGYRTVGQSSGLTSFAGLGEVLVRGVNDGGRLGPGFTAEPAALAELERVATMAAVRQLPLEIHVYTDDAARQILDVFERVAQRHPLGELRWAIAHLNTATPQTIARMKALGLALSVQMGPYFEGPDLIAENGAEAAGRSAARLALDQGLVVAGGTDATRIGDYRMWPGIEYHITGQMVGGQQLRPDDQRLQRLEALRSHTRSSAWLAYADDERGSLRAGKLADLAVLDRPYLRITEQEISEIRSELTLLGGRPVHDPRGWFGPR